MKNFALGVGHPEAIDLSEEMLAQIEHEAAEQSMTVEEWILTALREKMQEAAATQC